MAKTNYELLKKTISTEIAKDVDRKLKPKRPVDDFNQVIFNQGMQWFNSGLPLEDAPAKLRSNTNFINGFNKAKRIRDVENYLYDLGVSYFADGLPTEAIPEKYRENPHVLLGYLDAKSKVNGKK